jgi:hypothetical protein
MTVGRQDNLKSLALLMESVASGRKPKAWGQIIRAQYGEGKTHLMHAMANLAWDANWVVSMVSISKEAPLDRLDYIYPKIAANTFRPGSTQPGLEPMITEALAVPYLLAQSRSVDLTERTRAILDNLVRQETGLTELVGDLHGQFLTLGELKRIHRENFGKPLKIPSTRIKDEICSYLALVDWLIGHAGYQGWLILIDEVELIGKFGRGGRARSYANLGRFLSGVGERTLSIWAVAGNFQTDVIVQRQDMGQAPGWLLSRPQEAKDANLARLALDELSAARPLSRPNPEQIRELVERVYDLHQEAYEWHPPVSRDRFYDIVRENVSTVDARLRTWIRLTLTLLDLWFQYGVQDVLVSAGVLKDLDLSEEKTAAEAEDREDDTGAIFRRRIFE